MRGAIERAKEIAKKENAFMPLQFENPANPLAHYETTGPEIFRDCGARLDAFVAGIGSGGTITGAGRFLKEHLSDVRIIGVEPDESPFITTGKSGTHGIQGIGAGFIPHTLDTSVVDFVDTSSFEDSCRFCSLLARSEGMLCGISSGAALCAAVREAERINDENALVVVILPDTGERYLSQNLFGS
jgi:cysteine synthase A